MRKKARLQKIITILFLAVFTVFGIACKTVEQREEPRAGLLGIRLINPGPEELRALGLGTRRGAFVIGHYIGSPADRAGIKAGDFIVAINRVETPDTETGQQIIRTIGSGNTAVVTVIRDGTSLDFTAVLGTWTGEFAEDNRWLWPGFVVHHQSLNVTRVTAGSPAAFTGIQTGDRITRINGIPVTNLLSFYRVLREQAGNELMFTYIRNGVSRESARFRY